MSTAHRPPGRHRLPGALAAGVLTTVLLAGCGGDGDAEGPSASSTAASSSAEQTEQETTSDLASGLLPAEAFGPDATVAAISPEQLRQGAGLAAAAAGADIQPESCRAAVEGTQPDLDDVEDVAAQTATAGGTSTVEMLLRGGPLEDAVARIGEAAERCPEAQITLPGVGEAALTFENLPVDDLGDGAALLRSTTVVPGPDGPQASIPTLVGAVQDGDRLLLLLSIVADPTQPGADLDPEAFTELLEQAYERQADALG
ncbi:hypothetical protein DQ244_15725 [Blastococcus sp. TBT05-19]|uniref:hypothetical protein n=1 Tax=Blastococcus sp. TBT05-19 TaxID=2250581 RepID=UPI000DE9D1AB|nr:hypothetical protein [Blastococcus sp. TBT05-19]RBY88017.1 hypothetical protein DQ244_15725 [Blastococcus sp. TBT05-19]